MHVDIECVQCGEAVTYNVFLPTRHEQLIVEQREQVCGCQLTTKQYDLMLEQAYEAAEESSLEIDDLSM